MFRKRSVSPTSTLQKYLRSDRLRLVINALHAKSGGGVTYLRNILPLLAEDERLEIHIFLHSSQLSLFRDVDERVVVHAFDFKMGFTRLLLWEQLVLPVMIKLMSADLLFSPANFGSILVGKQVTLLRNALAVAKTETRWSKRFYWIALGIVTFLSLLRSTKAIAVSKYAADSLSLGLSDHFKDKIHIVHHGTSPLFTPDPTVEREDFLLAVSDIYVQKNLHNLFVAAKTIFSRHPHLKLKIAGEKIDAWYYDRVVALSDQLGIADNIEFLGRLDTPDLLDLYRRCRVFVFPSTAETFGNPLVEAMACGAPLACSNSTAMPEIVGDTAILFDPLDTDAMAAAILRLLDDDNLRRDLSARGVNRAKSFSWPRTATATIDVLIQAAGIEPR